MDSLTGNAQVRAVKSLGDLPLVVISRSPSNRVLAEYMPPLPTETEAKVLQMWDDLQGELAGLSSNSTRIIAAHAGHDIQIEEPRLVVDAIHKLVNEALESMMNWATDSSSARSRSGTAAETQ